MPNLHIVDVALCFGVFFVTTQKQRIMRKEQTVDRQLLWILQSKHLSFLRISTFNQTTEISGAGFFRSLRLVRMCCDCGWVCHTAPQRLTTSLFSYWGELGTCFHIALLLKCIGVKHKHSPKVQKEIPDLSLRAFHGLSHPEGLESLATKSPFAVIFKDKLLACSLGCLSLRRLNGFIVLPPVYLTIFWQVTLDG